ncbi:MAG TPA: SET domain-containing protein-lysine N-methyltransferase [Bacteriovoracaceae bacterium]|nr:SET domain-containing protein-lysine N-methyltransferase [Bacteriovoracaceae bacterium]
MKTFITTDARKGRGVYARAPILKGELIERCHLLLIKLTEVPDSLEGYVFEFNVKNVALALGNGSLFNHNDRPNADFTIDVKNKILVVKATKIIYPDEEITINYRYSKAEKMKFKLL